MKVFLEMDGSVALNGSTLIMHNERLADALDEFNQLVAETSKKRSKTLEDHKTVAHSEFGGGLYTDPVLSVEDYLTPNGTDYKVILPAWNILRCLQGGATSQKKGKDVLRGIYPLVDSVPLTYDGGPLQPHELWIDGRFALRKGVGVGQKKVMRTRPIFTDWSAELPVEVDATVFDLHTLRICWKHAGTYVGLGDMRPVYGRFNATVRKAAGDE